ncbi:M28 family peptidase [Pontixanthobacter aquaemixtae]|uniref:M28 family peptidase n=1 Tax=Pontixanthobacter aquaemixtae TaxID=1958940 RepID=A0A844ZRG0_9SPHN|nr:M28 family peptidase [Pontixanthobacter aquaemixtae]MXO90445.1 M28 family peptidase [Pontixanthobacter aquaemixtae]
MRIGGAQFAGLAALFALAGCASIGASSSPTASNLDAIEGELRAHIAILASDEFEGRRPGTMGERKALRYLAETWQSAGLETATNDPANPWFEPVELGLWAAESATAKFERKGTTVAIPDDAIALFASGRRALIEDAPLQYVGRLGASLEQSELAGRVAIMEWGHAGQIAQREALLENGAAAVLAIIADDDDFAEIRQIREKGAYRLSSDADGSTLDGIITAEAATALIGARYAQLKSAAAQEGFRPQALDLVATLDATSSEAVVQTHNLIAKLPGRDPDAGVVLLMAHWDHFGQCLDESPDLPGQSDRICNGAVDNASGLAVLTELAERLGAMRQMDRDIYFVATTAEEWGLLGARAFSRNPPIPLESIIAGFNIDSIGVAPRGGPVAIVGEGLTALDDEVKPIIAQTGRGMAGQAFAELFVQRQDGWALLQRDVPVLMVSSAFAQPDLMRRYARERYHMPSDEIDAVELGGAAEDLLLHIDLVRHFANVATFPQRPVVE